MVQIELEEASTLDLGVRNELLEDMSKISSILRIEPRINLAKRLGGGGSQGRRKSCSRKRKQLVQRLEDDQEKENKATSRFLTWMIVIY